MIRTRAILIGIYIISAVSALIGSLARDVQPMPSFCQNSLMESFAPWSSGCFYSAYFSQENVTSEQLDREVKKLNQFVNQGGMAPDIHLYRLRLHIKHQNQLRTNFQDLHSMYLRYTKSDHQNLNIQTDYLQFLHTNRLTGLSQDTLNNYCSRYFGTRNRVYIVDKIKTLLQQKQVPLDLSECYLEANAVVD